MKFAKQRKSSFIYVPCSSERDILNLSVTCYIVLVMKVLNM